VYIVFALFVIYLLARLFLYMRKKVAEAPAVGLVRRRDQEELDRTEPAPAGLGAAGARRRGGLPIQAAHAEAPGAHSAHATARAQETSQLAPASRQVRAGRRGLAAQLLAASAPPPVQPVLAGRRGRGTHAGPAEAEQPVRQDHASPAGPAVRKLIPLLGAAAAPRPPAPPLPIPKKRVRPTVTSIRRAMPREMQHASSLPPLIEMRVNLQNHRVGFRNVHRIPQGAVRSVGGRSSAYLVFLVPVPSAIAEIRNVDGTYVFTPLRPELFPDLAGPVQDCLDKEIPFVSPRGRELTLSFRMWVSLLDEINLLMRQAGSTEE